MTATAPDARAPESLGAVLGLGLGLAVILAAVLATFAPTPPPPEGSAWLAEHFDPRGAPPFGLQVAPSLRFPDGQVVVRLLDPAAPLEATAEPVPPSPQGPGSFGGGERGGPSGGGRDGPRGAPGGGGFGGGGSFSGPGPRTDWSAVAVSESGAAPVEVAFTSYPRSRTKAIVEGLFGSLRFRGIGEIGGQGGEMPIDSGHLDWFGYEASYVHLRHFEKVAGEPRFHDTLRVNLTLGERATVLHARWARGQAGSLEPVEALLANYAPRGAPAAGAASGG